MYLQCHRTNTYGDLRPNRPLCVKFSEIMTGLEPEQRWDVGNAPAPGAYSTDQGETGTLN